MSEFKESQRFINLGVVLNKKGEVLMIRRTVEETGKNGSILKWAFPGGRQRGNETREECLKREIFAETGYAVAPAHKISLRVHPQFPIVIVYYLCYLASEKPAADPVEPDEVAEIRWVKREDIPNLVTTDLDRGVKKQLGLR
ncbi:MAG: NUDIX hydrolase [Candidatus Liptonbacteria bacterium]|nr:NUDIX hydrolase [Candidatus Liptonbacteria bacterium]